MAEIYTTKDYILHWYGKKVHSLINRTMLFRVQASLKLIKRKLRSNLNKPVKITQGPRGGRVVERSQPGEYPRRETGTLRDSIQYEVNMGFGGVPEGRLWSTAPYANYLEFKLQRKLFHATYLECLPLVKKILGKKLRNSISWNETLTPGDVL